MGTDEGTKRVQDCKYTAETPKQQRLTPNVSRNKQRLTETIKRSMAISETA